MVRCLALPHMNLSPRDANDSPEERPGLLRSLGLAEATSLNIANMIGIGPFITIPIFLQGMQGPHALIAWVFAAVLVICDGLVWSELGAALPGSGGTYHYLREIVGRNWWGRALVFLYIWQFLATGALETASGYVGGMNFLTHQFPHLGDPLYQVPTLVPGSQGGLVLGTAPIAWTNLLAAAVAAGVALLLCRNTSFLGRLSVFLCLGTVLTTLVVIVAGLMHFRPALLAFPPDAVRLNGAWAVGLAASMRVGIYDYLGYYNVCHMGEEVRDPGRTIPRAVLLSVVIVAAIYMTMNLSIIGVIPWQQAMQSKNVVADFMQLMFGATVANWFTVFIIWAALAGLFAMTMGYARIPYAAARQGDFFRIFGRLHSSGRYPAVSLLVFGALVSVGCFLDLNVLVNAAVTIRIPLQFISQIIALHVMRTRRPDIVMPFRMWLYPLPSLIALVGWLFLLCTAGSLDRWLCIGVTLSGVLAFAAWQFRVGEARP